MAWLVNVAARNGTHYSGLFRVYGCSSMGNGLTPKQENFVLAYLETGNASEAYRRIYDISNSSPASINRKAVELLENGKITARIEELRKPIREKACLTLEEHLNTLQRLRDKAEESMQFTAAITAETNRGKASGLYTEKVEQKTTHSGAIAVDVSVVSPITKSALDDLLGR